MHRLLVLIWLVGLVGCDDLIRYDRPRPCLGCGACSNAEIVFDRQVEQIRVFEDRRLVAECAGFSCVFSASQAGNVSYDVTYVFGRFEYTENVNLIVPTPTYDQCGCEECLERGRAEIRLSLDGGVPIDAQQDSRIDGQPTDARPVDSAQDSTADVAVDGLVD